MEYYDRPLGVKMEIRLTTLVLPRASIPNIGVRISTCRPCNCHLRKLKKYVAQSLRSSHMYQYLGRYDVSWSADDETPRVPPTCTTELEDMGTIHSPRDDLDAWLLCVRVLISVVSKKPW